MSESSPVQRARRLGLLESAVAKWLTREAHVRDVRPLGERFQRITLAGEALRRVAWVPGQKVQPMLGGWVQRTYTPLGWDAALGTTELCAYVHGDSPASDWARHVAVGQRCAVFGPRGSLDLNALARPGLLFGDETSFGLAHALRFTPSGSARTEIVLEVSSLDAAQEALDALGVRGAHLIERRAGDAHLAEVEALVTSLSGTHALEGWVLTGKATSIQALTQLLRRLGAPRSHIQSKAYWSPGKVGLD